MSTVEKISHAAERKAFETLLDSIIQRGQTEDVSGLILKMVKLIGKIKGQDRKDEDYQWLTDAFSDPDNKWVHFMHHLLRDYDANYLKTFLVTAGYEAGFRGFATAQKNAENLGINVPWIVLMDPTTACNRNCIGCWAAEYGHQQSLSYEEMDKVLTEAKVLGTHACLLTGGEPLLRKKDIIKLCEKHRDIAFHAFTNGTLIDDEFCEDMRRLGNLIVSVSVEGYEDANDSRRGKDSFKMAMDAMERMKAHRLPFGVSICYTSRNYEVVTSDEFLQMLIDKGCVFAWYFHYMPVGMDASTELLLKPDQRAYMKNRIREIRGVTGGKEIFAIDFQNDGEFTGGCIAGGKLYCHINAAGDVEPCVFIHYSGANIKEKSFLECLQQPLFKAYHDGQPFNENHLRPCPMLENPEILPKMVAETGAHSTDLLAPESPEHLYTKTKPYADNWKPEAEKLWAEEHGEQDKNK